MTAPANLPTAIMKPKLRYVTLAQFLKRYAHTEGGYKYELNKGVVEKTKTMNQDQAHIEDNLLRLFVKTSMFTEGGSIFFEKDINTINEQLRRPDAAIFTPAQRKIMSNANMQIPIWVAEIISDSDNINRVNTKLEEYFQAGVQVVWHIFPETETVYVYTAIDKVEICKNQKVCNGLPALSGFEITATQLFAH
ncbi:MAG: Uma2 family endonuclease [Saprospiraceae bacterium]|nr:Uma2 family endonuclease [Saprospiraceae bacterium]